MNLLWSEKDGPNRFIVVDSAGTHSHPPRSLISALGQTQQRASKEDSVEEGHQKIVRLEGYGAAVICGDKDQGEALVRAILADLPDLSSGAMTRTNLFFEQLSPSVELAVTIAALNGETPFLSLRYPERQMVFVQRGDVYVEGSIDGAPLHFIKGIVESRLTTSLGIPPDMTLTGALAASTAAAIEYDLPSMSVGGAFFGAYIGKTGFHWQPDITYFFYDPGFTTGLPHVERILDDTPAHKSEHSLVTCRVRDDKFVSISTMSRRGVVAGFNTDQEDVLRWKERWQESLSRRPFLDAEYMAFVPCKPGRIVVVRNDGTHVKQLEERIALSLQLTELLEWTSAGGQFQLTFLL